MLPVRQSRTGRCPVLNSVKILKECAAAHSFFFCAYTLENLSHTDFVIKINQEVWQWTTIIETWKTTLLRTAATTLTIPARTAARTTIRISLKIPAETAVETPVKTPAKIPAGIKRFLAAPDSGVIVTLLETRRFRLRDGGAFLLYGTFLSVRNILVIYRTDKEMIMWK